MRREPATPNDAGEEWHESAQTVHTTALFEGIFVVVAGVVIGLTVVNVILTCNFVCFILKGYFLLRYLAEQVGFERFGGLLFDYIKRYHGSMVRSQVLVSSITCSNHAL